MIHLRRTGNILGPVAAVLAYLVRRGSQQGPLFLFSDGTPLSRQRLVAELRQALSACGFDCNLYAGHSFRIGATTTAAAKSVEDSTIGTLGRCWSDAYQQYIRLDACTLAGMLPTLAS